MINLLGSNRLCRLCFLTDIVAFASPIVNEIETAFLRDGCWYHYSNFGNDGTKLLIYAEWYNKNRGILKDTPAVIVIIPSRLRTCRIYNSSQHIALGVGQVLVAYAPAELAERCVVPLQFIGCSQTYRIYTGTLPSGVSSTCPGAGKYRQNILRLSSSWMPR